MKKRYIGRLTEEERQELREVAKKVKSSAHKFMHVNIHFKADADGPAWTDKKIMESFLISKNTVIVTKRRYIEQGFEAALNRKKQDHPSRELDGES